MRYHLEIIKDIEKFLSANNLDSELVTFQYEVQASSTGSEVCIRVGSWLKSNEIIGLEKLTDEFVSYCHLNGLHPKKRSL